MDAYAYIFIAMNPMHHIRINVLKVTQKRLSEIAGCTQATVSRWERGELEPSRDELQRVRQYAKSRGLRWKDSLFFEVPAKSAELHEKAA